MPSTKPQLKTYTDQQTINKFSFIAKEENRTMSKQLEYLVKKAIKEYEQERGEIIIESKDNPK